jgi:hypothetical protein
MRRFVLVLAAFSGLSLSPVVIGSVTPAFAGCGQPGTAGSNYPTCPKPKPPKYGWVPGSHHTCYWDNRRHTIESCRIAN